MIPSGVSPFAFWNALISSGVFNAVGALPPIIALAANGTAAKPPVAAVARRGFFVAQSPTA
jgi:hypothetical protein